MEVCIQTIMIKEYKDSLTYVSDERQRQCGERWSKVRSGDNQLNTTMQYDTIQN